MLCCDAVKLNIFNVVMTLKSKKIFFFSQNMTLGHHVEMLTCRNVDMLNCLYDRMSSYSNKLVTSYVKSSDVRTTE